VNTHVNGAPQAQGQEAPHLGGVRAGPALAGALYTLLALSALLSFWAQESPGAVPTALGRAAPWFFLAFAGCFAVYRVVIVRARKYPAFKAFFQIGAALFFFVVLVSPRGKPADAGGDAWDALMADADPRVRALAVEVAGYRPGGSQYASRLVRALGDPDGAVRREAHAALVRMTGRDLGDPGQPAGLAAWQERYR
jgi:hypothetical protein